MANTKASLTEQNTQTYPSNNSGSITALAVKSFNNNFINAVATLGDTNVFTQPQTFGDVVQVNSDVFANNVYADNICNLSGSNTFLGPTNTFSGSVNIQTASIQFLTVDTIVSSSTINNTGSNQLGDSAGDTQTLWGTVNLPSGPLKVTGSVSSTGGFTGSLQGTSSWANNATTASHALTAVSSSFATNATSASYALNSTNAVSSSFANNATSASYASSSTSASFALTASFLLGAVANAVSASYAATASKADNGFPYTGSAQISGSLTITNDTDGVVFDIKQPSHTTESIYSMRMGFQADVTESLAVGGNLLLSGSFNNTYRIVIPTTIDNATLTGSLAGTASWANNATTASYALNAVPTNTGSLLTTASVSLNTITFTKGDASTFAITVDTGSGGGGGMNLGANTFTGSQTLSSSATPASLIFRVSGSLASFVTESNGFGSTNTGYGNIIFQNRTNAAFSGSEIVSGSSNIIFANGTATNSLKGMSGFGNIGVLPLYSGSIPSGQFNFFGGTLTSSGSRQALNQNNILGTITLVESNNISASFTNNYVNAVQAVVNTNYSGSTGAFASTVSNNTINGASHLIQIAGSGSQNRQFANNLIGGSNNTASLSTPTGSSNNSGSLINTLIYGNGLIVSGTQINTSTLHGGAFVGRYNETGSLADNSVVFAVGAGTSNTLRKTSLYVSASGDVVINATSGGLASSFNNRFAPNYVAILNNTINSNTTVGGPGNGSFVTNGGSITGGGNNLNNVLIATEISTITAGRQTAIIAGENNTINVTVPSNSQRPNIIAASIQSQITGATSGSMNAILASSGSFISQSNNSVILANGIVNTTIINASSSVALGRDTAYTASGSYTLYTQNVDISGSLRVNGNLQYNFGEFWATSSNTPAAGVSQSVIFDSTGVSSGVATSGSGDLLKITNAGTYNIQFSVQVNTSAGADTLYVWFKKNGTNIAASNSKAVLANNTAQLLTANILDTAAANDYYEIAYQTANGNAQILSEAATGNLPQIPSVITTITQVR